MPRRGPVESGDRHAVAEEHEVDGDLSPLMDLEERLAHEQAAAEAQAAKILRVARDAAEVRVRALEAELEAEANQLAVVIEADRDRALALLAHEHNQQAAVYAAVEGPRAEGLADWVVEELLRRLGAVGERRADAAEEKP